MYRSKIVAVDLCDTIAEVTEAIEGIYGPRPDPLNCYHPATPKPFWDDPENRIAREIFKFARPVSCNLVNYLTKYYQIVYLTSRPEWSRYISEKWLKQNNFPAAPIVHTQDKYFWVLKNGAALAIEDLPEHIIKLQTIAPVLVPPRPWNQRLYTNGGVPTA